MSESATSPLVMDGVQAGYGDFKALFNITLHVDAGEIVTLLGANGAGKTTTLRVISGLVHPTKGAVHFDGKNISTLPPHEIVELGISHVPEGRQLFPHMSVEENLALGAYIGRARQHIKQTMEEQFTLFPLLKERRKQLAGTLSGGEQQMVAIARGLMTPAQAAHARRAFARPGAEDRRRGVREGAGDRQAWSDGADRRAERRGRPQHFKPRLRRRERRGRSGDRDVCK